MKFDDPAFTIRMDDRHIIHVRTPGLWTPEGAERYWVALQPFLDESRRRLGYGKVLVDRRGSPIMTMPMIQAMPEGILAHYRPDDRLALVVDTSPLKMQVRQNYPLQHLEAFLSHEAALAWLQNA